MAMPAEEARSSQPCAHCGHWQSNPEFGMDRGSGYCEVWEKLTSATYTCDRFVAIERYREDRKQELEEFLEEMENHDAGE